MSKTIKDCKNTIVDCEIKIKDLQRYQLLSYSKKREIEIGYYKELIKNNKNLINHLNK